MLNPINAPKAKPVKIRIMSGGEEHSSLNSLCHNFKLEDVKKGSSDISSDEVVA